MSDKAQAYLSVCAVYRDEAPYLREWIEFHRLVGVERFFLYNHASVDEHRAALAPYVEDGLVIVEDWPDVPNVQFEIYTRCLEQHRSEARWIAFIDIDEFVYSPTGQPLSELLVEYEEFSGVGANWAMYGTSGHRTKPPGLVIESYLWRGDSPAGDAARQVKCIVDPRRATRCESSHWFEYSEGGMVDQEKRPLERPYSERPLYDKIRVNHYYTRSEEECMSKYARPRVNDSLLMGGGQPPLEGLHVSLNDERDDSILIYAPAVEAALRKTNERAPFEPPPVVVATTRAREQAAAADDGGERHYYEWGASALRFIEAAVESGRRVLPPGAERSGWAGRMLVIPCGRGQVVRALRAAFPEAAITAGDVDPVSVEFCAEAYGTEPLHLPAELTDLELADSFDLIWCGSLFAHLDADRWLPLLELLERRLRPWGMLFLATNGRYVASVLEDPEAGVGPAAEMRAEYERTGFSHRPGERLGGWADADARGLEPAGVALASLAWVYDRLAARPGLRVLASAERAWNRHQDVVACAREGSWALVRDLLRADPGLTEEELVALTGYGHDRVRSHLAAVEAQKSAGPA